MHDSADSSIAPSRVCRFATGAEDVERIDDIAVEAPLEVHINGQPTTVLMRTPGSDEELVTGFLFGEGIIKSAGDIRSIQSAERDIIHVELVSGRSPAPERLFFSNSSCGVCGKKTIDSIQVQAAPSDSKLSVSRRVLQTLPEKLRQAQTAFAKTGGVHASGLFSASGELLVLREDVGRHNALDKLVGWALANGRIPLSDYVLLVSGRVSFELVQKTACAGLPVIAAVGAPSTFAIELAERFHLTLVGFLRADSMNVYANRWRVGDV